MSTTTSSSPPSILWPDSIPTSQAEGDGLPSAHQVEQLRLATLAPIGCFIGGPGTGKAMPIDWPILTPHGYKPMRDVVIGSEVIGSNGKSANVVGVYPQGMKPIYRVTFSDGSTAECCNEHLWFTATRRERKNARRRGLDPFGLGRVRTTEELAATLRSADDHANHYIPLVQPVEFAGNEVLPIDPYELGLLLGDGCLQPNAISISTPDAELVDAIAQTIPQSVSIRKRRGQRCPIYGIVGNSNAGNDVLDSLRSLGLAGKKSVEKFVPNTYKFTSSANRLALLQGLLDTDGHSDGHVVEYSTSSPLLAVDIVFLIESLGGTATTTWRECPAYMHKGERRFGKPNARVIVKLPAGIAPFRLTRKRDRYITRTKYQPCRYIVSVDLIGKKQAQCIAVDAPDNLYVSDRFVVTHNTHSLSFLLKQLIETHGEDAVAVCAPTGKAAVRATQSLQARGISIRASTIHQLLEIGRNGHDGGGWGFMRNRDNPLEQQFVIVDESSMIDTNLMADVLDACGTGTHILFVGDPYQLPPVGHGAPLRDMLAAGVPHGELTEVRRNAGRIVHACSDIKAGRPVTWSESVDLDSGENLRLVECGSTETANLVCDLLTQGVKGFHPVWQTQVIVGLNDRGSCSRTELNGRLQKLLNPDGVSHPKCKFWSGDKVICLKNTFLRPCVPTINGPMLPIQATDAGFYRDLNDKELQVYVANGEIGRVVAVGDGSCVCRFGESDTLVRVGAKRGKSDDDAGSEGGGGSDSDFDLGYAVTCHKCQGSESPCVIVVADDSAGAVATREWWYTAISRASKLCVVVGPRMVVAKQSAKQSLVKRKTFLRELIEASRQTHGASK